MGGAMTSAEWAACGDPAPMLAFLFERPGGRKLRLCACAFARREPGYARDELRRLGVELAERVADGLVPSGEREALRERLQLRKEDEVMRHAFDRARATRDAERCLAYNRYGLFAPHRTFPPGSVAVLRCVFGNPLRPVAFDPTWRTPTAVAIAEGMYEGRDFGAMPILADALQDAGCDDEEVLGHCREIGATHVRGCWVVDLVLGKE